MREEVNDVLELRANDPRGLNRTMTASFAVHLGMVFLFGVVLRGWIAQPRQPPKMMTISLGVSVGPKTTGMTALGGRAVDEVEPQPKRPEPVKPAPPPKPEVAMNVPPKTKPEASKPSDNPFTTPPPKPSTGSQARPGTSLAETGARGEGAGLSFGGGLGAPTLQLAPDFCCPAYAEQILSIISARWQRNQPERGEIVVLFTIKRDGTIGNAKGIDRSSGSRMLELKSLDAIPPQLLALPTEYKGSSLTVHLTFPYGGF